MEDIIKFSFILIVIAFLSYCVPNNDKTEKTNVISEFTILNK